MIWTAMLWGLAVFGFIAICQWIAEARRDWREARQIVRGVQDEERLREILRGPRVLP